MDNSNQLISAPKHFRQYIINRLSFMPLWRGIDGIFKDLTPIDKDTYLLLDNKNNKDFELLKIENINNDKRAMHLFIGGEVAALISLVALFLFGFFTNSHLSISALLLFLVINGVSLFVYSKKYYKIFNILMIFGFIFFVYWLGAYGQPGELYNSLVFYCALGYAMYFVLPTLLFKYNAMRSNAALFFKLKYRSGLMLVAYLDDAMDEEIIKKMRTREERVKAHKRKRKHYDDDDE